MNLDLLTKKLKVAKRIQETPEAVSLVLEIPEDLKKTFHYQAGQFVTFFLNINGENLQRSYSLSTSPLVDKEFKVTVKKVQNGRGSTFLCEQVKEGDVLHTTPPAGQFFKPSLDASGVHYLLFAAGSGITPIFSILKTVLTASPKNLVTLVFCNRNEESIIYARELNEWQTRSPQQLKVLHTLSQPSSAWTGKKGRLDKALVNEAARLFDSAGRSQHAYMCGPVEFMQTIRATLQDAGWAKENIHEENFATAVHKPGPQIKDGWTLIGPDKDQAPESPEQIIAVINGETFEVAAKSGQNLLETLLEAGAQPPYSCMDGACMACLGKITAGRVYQEDPGILIDDNIKNCEALTCQAKPLSRIVKVTYDNL